MKYPFYKQLDAHDCGPACLRMLAAYYGKRVDATCAKRLCGQYRNGTTMYTISRGAGQLGFNTVGVRWTAERFLECFSSPCIVQWKKKHFIVVWDVTDDKVKLGDPAVGPLTYSIEDFLRGWISHTNEKGYSCGVALLVEPGQEFNRASLTDNDRGYTLRRMAGFLAPHKGLLLQLILTLLLGSAISLVFPFLMQAIVDIGIGASDTSFIFCVLAGQMLLSFGMCANRYISSWLALHVSSRVSIAMVAFFLEKLMKMRITFFDTKMIGDIITRIHDFTRIESFLTSYMISILMAIVGVLVYGFVLARYGLVLLGVYLVCMVLYLAWTISFRNRRRKLDYMRFQQVSGNQSMVIHYIQGMQEIKLNHCEEQKLRKWRDVQMDIYKVGVKGLAMQQMQDAGGILIDNVKNILITFLCAYAVIQGEMTLGMLMAVTYVIGQLDGPFFQMASFVKAMQEAQISLERINEINRQEDEETDGIEKKTVFDIQAEICFKDVTFIYPGPVNKPVLNRMTFTIPAGKVTAIVGESGSGKTTLLKLLMGFYQPVVGQITLGDVSLADMDVRAWRQHCSAVLQSGYLFTETIAQNIAMGQDDFDMEDVIAAARQAEIHDFIMSLPLRYDTVVGDDGLSLSGGQRQRIFIARAIYRNSPFVFMDEPTNALDACNEENILANLTGFYQNRTVVIVAHRLSTILNADHILVLHEGKLVEQGTHRQLVEMGGYYSTLISKQMQ